MRNQEIVSKEDTPLRIKRVGIIIALFFYISPIIIYFIVKNMDIPIGFNTDDHALFTRISAAFISVFWIIASIFLYFGLRKKRPVYQKYEKGKKLQLIQKIGIVCTILTIGIIIYLFNNVIGLIFIPLGIWLLYFSNYLKWEKVTKRGIRVTTTIVLVLLIVNVFFIGAVSSYYLSYNNKLSGYNTLINEKNPVFDIYGGLENYPQEWGEFEATGYFDIQQFDEKYWFITPLGNPFLSKGVNDVSTRHPLYYENVMEKYGSSEDWADATINLLVQYGFNTITSWSAPEVINNTLPYTVLLNFGDRFRRHGYEFVADYFDPGFETLIDEIIEDLVVPRKNDLLLLGYFTDNELIWGPDWRTHFTLLQMYMDFDMDAPGRQIAVDFLKNESISVSNFNNAWKTDISSFDEIITLPSSIFAVKTDQAEIITSRFGGIVAERYASISAEKIREAAPNHLILGCRFAGNPGEEIMENTAKYTDVFSYAGYNFDYTWDQWDDFVKRVNRPILVEEFSYRALDVGLPNIYYSGPVVLNQHQRSIEFSKYVEILMSKPYGVGYHWYSFCDNQKYSFFHGENYGIVNISDEPYIEFLEMALGLNLVLDYVHGGID